MRRMMRTRIGQVLLGTAALIMWLASAPPASQAAEEKDYGTANFLQWFVSEQVEEEAQADEIVQTLKLIGDSPHGLVMLDRQLAQRE